jgi:hypothetical protein
MVIASAAAVASSRSEAFDIGMAMDAGVRSGDAAAEKRDNHAPVRSVIIVWKLSSDSRRPCAISACAIQKI